MALTGAMKERYSQYQSLIDEANATNPALAAEPYLLPSVLAHESGFNAAASHLNANGTTDMGIAQLNSAYHPSALAYDPNTAIPAAASILNEGLSSCGSVSGALTYYNGGHCGASVGSYVSDVSKYFSDFGGPSAGANLTNATQTGSQSASSTASLVKSGAKSVFGQSSSTIEELLFTVAGIGLLIVAFAKIG